MSLSLLKNVKKGEIVRCITFLLRNTSPHDAKREICNNLQKINSDMKKKLELIMNMTATNVKTIRVEQSIPVQPIISDVNAIEIGPVMDTIHNVDKLRIIINFENIDPQNLNDAINKYPNISHIVEIKHTSENTTGNDMNGFESSATLYLPTIPQILSVIEDVMLDISLYYTLIGDKSIEKFDAKKINHIKEYGLNSENWNAQQQKEYISLAGYFKGESINKFDALGYVDCWISLAKKVLNTDELPIKPIAEQLKRHIKYRQLSDTTISSDYNKLDKGKYYLIRLDRIPKNGKTQSQLLSLFGGTKLTVGKTKFYPIDKVSVFKDLEHCVSFFIVEK
jgi:hypothetical protein